MHNKLSSLAESAPIALSGLPPMPGTCRSNSLRGQIDASKASYPPVESVQRALRILTYLSGAHVASVRDIHNETGLPKPTIVRMLDTLISEGFVARDNMCGGYHVTHKVRDLGAGYEGIAELIEVARPFAIELTAKIKWPVGLGTFDDDAMLIRFWTGTISPWVHANRLVGSRARLLTSAMGRAYVAFCSDAHRDAIIGMMRAEGTEISNDTDEAEYRRLLANVRSAGYALRAPETEPKRNTTVAVPVLQRDGIPLAAITVSFFTSAVPKREVFAQIVEPLRERVKQIEDVLAYLREEHSHSSVAA